MLQPGIQQVAFGHPIAQLTSGVKQLLAAAAMAEGLLELLAGICINHQPLQIRPAHLLKTEMGSTSRELEHAARFPEAHCGELP